MTGDWIERNDEWLGCGDSGVGRAGDQEAESVGHYAKFDWQARQWLAIDLGVDWFGVDGFAHQAVGLPEMDALFLAQIAEPQCWQITQIFQPALRSETHKFELVLEQVGFGGDFKRSTIMFRAADNDQRDIAGLSFAGDAKMGELVIESFASALPPVRH